MTLPPDAPLCSSPEDAVSGDWPHRNLYLAVREAIRALPSYFESDLRISGVLATDLFTFNTSLGATIEAQVVETLNQLRERWDPDRQYGEYAFVRQPQTFPDVTLRAESPEADPTILMGIELKGWYVLAKEREPSFRFRTTPGACAEADLLVVFPWVFDNVVSGRPQLFAPYVEQARFVAEYRNWYWQYEKESKGGTGQISMATSPGPYPSKSDQIADKPTADRGGNFGRIARTNIMDDFINDLFAHDLLGIRIEYWQRFLSIFSADREAEAISRQLDRMAERAVTKGGGLTASEVHRVRDLFAEIAEILAYRSTTQQSSK